MVSSYLCLWLVGVLFFLLLFRHLSNIIYLFLKIIFCSVYVYNLAMGVILGDIKLMKYVKTAQVGGFLKTSIV